MANQKITELSKITQLTKEDLFVVVDVNEDSPMGTPSGHTKQMTAEQLAQDLINIGSGKVGIKFANLADTPDSYLGNEGNFIRVTNDIDPDTGGPSGLEYVDSPGAAEHTFGYEENFDASDDYAVGSLVRIDAITRKFSLAKSLTEESSECVGIIKKIKDINEGLSKSISIVFGGYVEFPEKINIQIRSDDVAGQDTDTGASSLVSGDVYFLGTNGALSNFDPALTSVEGITSHVSKPLFVALGIKSGVFVNYRGLHSPDEEEHNKFVLEYITSCSNTKVGDVVRIRRQTEIDGSMLSGIDSREGVLNGVGGETGICLATAKYFSESDVLGLVIESTPDYFKVQTDGMVSFNWTDEDGNQQKIFEPGYQYYLDDVPAETGDWKGSLRTTIFDPTNSLIPEIGPSSPFRNSSIVDPYRQDSQGTPLAYSRPVFYAITENKILITNHRTYPSIEDACDRCVSLTGDVSSEMGSSGLTTTIKKRYLSFDNIESETIVRTFLISVWPDANAECEAILYTNIGLTVTWIYEYAYGWIKKRNETIGDRFE